MAENYGIEVELVDDGKGFSVIKETLERIGVGSPKNKVLSPTCYILQKRGKYYIISFKNLFRLDGKDAQNYTDTDHQRQSLIAKMLQDWGFVKIVEGDENFVECEHYPTVTVIPYKDKNDWEIRHKYTIGKFKKNQESND